MPADLSPEAWAQIRSDYEHTDRPVEEICAEHDISAGTLRNRMRRWGWTRRRPPVPRDGPPAAPAPQIDHAAPPLPAVPQILPGEDEPAAIVPRLQNAVARVLPAIEATVATLSAQPAHPREMERAARVLAALTRTLRELNTLLRQCPVPAADDDMPEDIDEFRRNLARRIRLFVASRTGGTGEPPEPQGT